MSLKQRNQQQSNDVNQLCKTSNRNGVQVIPLLLWRPCRYTYLATVRFTSSDRHASVSRDSIAARAVTSGEWKLIELLHTYALGEHGYKCNVELIIEGTTVK